MLMHVQSTAGGGAGSSLGAGASGGGGGCGGCGGGFVKAVIKAYECQH